MQDRLAQVVELLQRHRLGEDGEYRQDNLQVEPAENYDQGQILPSCNASSTSCTLRTSPTSRKHCRSKAPDRLAAGQAERDGDILLEVSDAVRETLIADMDDHELLAAARRWTPTSWPTWPLNCPVMSFAG